MQLSKEQLLDAAQAAGYSRGLVDADLMLVAINAYCAQADARPVWQPIDTAPTDNKRLLYLARFDAHGKLQALDFDGSWDYVDEGWEVGETGGYMWCSAGGVEEPTHWAYQDEPLPLYTHPEASAPGLSVEDAMRIVMANWGDKAAIEKAFAANLTRASAATVAEPSEQGRMNELTRASAAGQAEGIKLGIAMQKDIQAAAREKAERECRHCGWLCRPNDAPTKKFYPLEPQAAQQQAEPVGDERAAFEEVARKEGWSLTKDNLGWYVAGITAHAWTAWQARAAQSGQRAGVAEDAIEAAAKNLAEDFDYPWEHMPAQGKDDFRAKVRSIAAMLAAPTQQQERSE